jgi:ammonium transporter, Amt family
MLWLGFTLVYAPSSTGGIIGGFEWTFFNGVPINKSLDYAPSIPGVSFATTIVV